MGNCPARSTQVGTRGQWGGATCASPTLAVRVTDSPLGPTQQVRASAAHHPHSNLIVPPARQADVLMPSAPLPRPAQDAQVITAAHSAHCKPSDLVCIAACPPAQAASLTKSRHVAPRHQQRLTHAAGRKVDHGLSQGQITPWIWCRQ